MQLNGVWSVLVHGSGDLCGNRWDLIHSKSQVDKWRATVVEDGHSCFAVMGWPGRAQRPNLLDSGWAA
jgi:hypothetical protein